MAELFDGHISQREYPLTPLRGLGAGRSYADGLVFNAPLGSNAEDLITGEIGTHVRAGTATYIDDAGVRQTAIANELRFENGQVLTEPAAENFFLNSDSPATQTINLALGTFTLWIEGTGSIAVAGNTATITGAGSATDESPVTFEVTVAGTVDCTVTGTPTIAQLEDSPVPSSYIPTTGSSATRATESGYPRWTLPADVFDAQGTVVDWWRPGFPSTEFPASVTGILSVSDSSPSIIHQAPAAGRLRSYDGTSVSLYDATWAADDLIKIVVKWGYEVASVSKFRIGVDTGSGIVWGSEQNFDGSFILGTHLRIGYNLFGPMKTKELQIYNKVLTDAEINALGSP